MGKELIRAVEDAAWKPAACLTQTSRFTKTQLVRMCSSKLEGADMAGEHKD
jgi:hypothetical protein